MAGRLQLLKSTEASSVTQVDMFNLFTSDYTGFLVKIEFTEIATSNGQWVYLRFANGTSVDATANIYEIGSFHTRSDSTGFNEYQGTAYDTDSMVRLGITNQKGGHTLLWIYNPLNTNKYTSVMAESTGWDNNPTTRQIGDVAIGVYKSTQSVNGFRWFMGSNGSMNHKTSVFGIL